MTEPTTRRSWIAYAALVVAAATALGVFFASHTYLLYSYYPDNRISWSRALTSNLVDWYLWALLFPLVYLVAARFALERGRLAGALAAHAVGGVLVALAKLVLDVRVARPLQGLEPGSVGAVLWRDFHANFAVFVVFAGLVHAVRYYRKFREREVRAAQLEASLAEARLAALRMQIHPHFLFNTLNAVSTLMHRDVAAAERVLSRLGDLLRLTAEAGGRQEVALAEELDFLRLYLEIQEVRFADRLRVTVAADPEALRARIPHLTLQPLVENSIRHGIAPRSGPGRIEVEARRADGRLQVAVRDDGLGLGGPPADPGGGVGLANTRARLEQLYGADFRFELRAREGGGAEVVLEIPFREAEA